MSTKHFFHEYEGLVLRSLKGLVHSNPTLSLIPQHKVIYNSNHDCNKVSIISGGGSGHEPAWSGYVGEGMLAAAVNGDIFGSPSAAQVMAGINAVKSSKGTILVITNYTGDKLHFGLACEKARAKGAEVAVLAITDDVALGRKRAGMVGRRGLAGNVLGLKILGAASEEGYSLEECLSIGKATNDNLITIGASLDHCHVLGRINHGKVAEDVCVLGMGIHNEPGLQHISPLPSPEELVKQMLACLLDPQDEDRAFVKFEEGDEVVLLVNNFGGTSLLELQALAHEAVSQLDMNWSIVPERTYCGTFETSLNGPGFSFSLFNLSGAARNAQLKEDSLFRLLDAPTTAPGWPKYTPVAKKASNGYTNGNGILTSGPKINGTHTNGSYTNGTHTNGIGKNGEHANGNSDIDLEGDRSVDANQLYSAVRQACERAIVSEPDLTRWDMEMGDGDCGESVKAVCQSVLKALPSQPSGSLLSLLALLTTSIDAMGGTLGAIFGIFLASLISSIKRQPESTSIDSLFSNAVYDALQSLKRHSGAREGDRTVMDALIPFCESFKETGSFEEAVKSCIQGAESTRGMKARFGRATYVKGRDGYVEPPDPGAWAVKEMVEGVLEIVKSS